jgi:hypothetical protein
MASWCAPQHLPVDQLLNGERSALGVHSNSAHFDDDPDKERRRHWNYHTERHAYEEAEAPHAHTKMTDNES